MMESTTTKKKEQTLTLADLQDAVAEIKKQTGKTPRAVVLGMLEREMVEKIMKPFGTMPLKVYAELRRLSKGSK